MEPSLKLIKIIRAALMAAIILYGLVGEILAQKALATPRSASGIYFAITLCAITLVGVIVAVRRLWVLPAEVMLAAQPLDVAPLMRWRAGYIATYAVSEAIALLGFVLRILGFTLSAVIPFYLVALILMMFFGPRRPANDIG